MEHRPVTSSNLASVGYDPEAKQLHVTFRNGATWRYDDVSPEAHQRLLGAPSVGSHFHTHIKSAHIATKLTPGGH